MRHLPFLVAALAGFFLPEPGSAGSFETQILVCLEDSLSRSPEIAGETLSRELEFCLSAPEALEGATIAKTLPSCRKSHGDDAVAACLVENGLG